MSDVNETLAGWSTTFIYSAMAVYTLAFIAFALDFARLAQGRGGGAGAVDGRRREARIAMLLTWLGFVIQLVGVVTRGLSVGRVPWSNMYEFSITGSLLTVAVFLGVSLVRDVRFLGALVDGVVLLMLGLAVSVFYADASALPPALQSYWLIIHVFVATASVGLFSVSFVVSLVQLAKDSRERRAVAEVGVDAEPGLVESAAVGSGSTESAETNAAVAGTSGGARATATLTKRPSASKGFSAAMARVLDSVPSAANLEALAFRINAVGFVLWTFTLIAGAIWAEHAWGVYWNWDAKEVWTFVIWIVYAGYLHARTTRGWAGRRAAYFAIVGYACIVFNFVIVNIFFNSQHAYSGVG